LHWNTPLVYFKQVTNRGCGGCEPPSNILEPRWRAYSVLIAPDQVQFYSGLVQPLPQRILADHSGPGDVLDRTSTAIREFLQRGIRRVFPPALEIIRSGASCGSELLDNLQATRGKLVAISLVAVIRECWMLALSARVCVLLVRPRNRRPDLFTRNRLAERNHLRDVLGLQPRAKAKKYLYDLFRKLGKTSTETCSATTLTRKRDWFPPPTSIFGRLFRATVALTGQTSFWPYDSELFQSKPSARFTNDS